MSELLRADARTNAALSEVFGAGGGIRLCMRRYVAAPCRSRMLPTPVRNARRLLGFVVVMVHYLTLLSSLGEDLWWLRTDVSVKRGLDKTAGNRSLVRLCSVL